MKRHAARRLACNTLNSRAAHSLFFPNPTKFLQANGLPHPYVMLFLAPLFWATRNVTGKLVKAWLSPYAFTFWRWLLVTALLSLPFRRQIRADWPQLKARAG